MTRFGLTSKVVRALKRRDLTLFIDNKVQHT